LRKCAIEDKLTGTSKQANLEQRVLGFIREQDLLAGQDRLLVAVSGGADSVCLLHVLASLQKELGISLHVAHLDHQLRGEDSEADARYVADLARQLKIPATVERRDVKSYHAGHHVSLEEAAREVRYNFLAQVAESVGAERAAVGHTVEDHVETILMHLIRGSGSRGLRGLQPLNLWKSSGHDLAIIRPLLSVDREETSGYCQQHRLNPRLDASNLSLSALRNRIRHQLLPLLRDYNPRVADALLRNARIAGDDLDYIDRGVDTVWDSIVQRKGNAFVLKKKDILVLPPALKRYLLRACLENLLGDLMDIEARHIEDMMDTLNKSVGKRIDLPGGLTFSVEYDRYLLGFGPAALSPFPLLEAEYKLAVPGSTSLPGWWVEAAISDARGDALLDNNFAASFDFARAGSQLTVRSLQPGDRFRPLGMEQPKKLGEFMIDAKIPRAWRNRVPIVCSPAQILWVVGERIDDRVRVTRNTERILRLEFKRS